MAGYVKMDTGLLDSTLWANKDQRDVFLTALLMASPHELEHPARQLKIDSLEATGFEVPPGWYGFVAAAGSGILRKAIVKQRPGMKALDDLGRPDPESRSTDYEGRRLVRIDGGYIVLNYIKYRDRDYTAAERSQRYRDRLKGKESPVTASHRDAVTPHCDVTEADAAASAKVHQPPSVSDAAGLSGIVALPSARGPWSPSAELLLRWKGCWPGMDLPAELGRIQTYLRNHPKVRFGQARLVPWVEDWLAKEAEKPPAGADGPRPAASGRVTPLRVGGSTSSDSAQRKGPPRPPNTWGDHWCATWGEHEAMLRETGRALKMAPEDLDAWVVEVKAEWDERHEEVMG